MKQYQVIYITLPDSRMVQGTVLEVVNERRITATVEMVDRNTNETIGMHRLLNGTFTKRANGKWVQTGRNNHNMTILQ